MGTLNHRAAAESALSVEQFIRWCATAISDHVETFYPSTRIPPTPGALETFVAGGVAAIRAADTNEVWLQFGLVTNGYPETPSAALYQAVSDTVRTLTASELVHDAFFVHKPPGIRLRVRTELAGRHALKAELNRNLARWSESGLITGWRPAVYEPERSLFGGPVSLRSVHRVFTADSLAWLDFHALAARPESPGPAWAMSLLMIQSLLAALEIVGWEDRGVWDILRTQAGRALDPSVRRARAMDRLARVLSRYWNDPGSMRTLLSPSAQELLDEYTTAVQVEAARWIAEYFTSPGAVLGPRAVAAHVIVFHWNRAGLPARQQAMFCEALASPPADLPYDVAGRTDRETQW